MAKKRNTSANNTLAVIGGIVYVSLILLFAWQTWAFVSWLFPDDQLLMVILTVLSFDGCALLFGCIHLFYHFKSRGAKNWVTAGWIVTNMLSALASIFYLVIESMFRFHLDVNQQTVDVGYGISIIALIFDGLVLTMWVYLEWKIRHPHHDEFEDEEEEDEPMDEQPTRSSLPVQQSVSTPVPPVTPAPSIDYDALAQAMIRHTGVLPAVQSTTNPLDHSPMDTSKASQPGTNGNGHQK